jgi:hypothetical protein
MSVLTIFDSSAKLNWSHLPKRVQKNAESNIANEKNTLTFVSDFTSPADEIAKFQPSKSESQKSAKRSRPFSHTSENWIG